MEMEMEMDLQMQIYLGVDFSRGEFVSHQARPWQLQHDGLGHQPNSGHAPVTYPHTYRLRIEFHSWMVLKFEGIVLHVDLRIGSKSGLA